MYGLGRYGTFRESMGTGLRLFIGLCKFGGGYIIDCWSRPGIIGGIEVGVGRPLFDVAELRESKLRL